MIDEGGIQLGPSMPSEDLKYRRRGPVLLPAPGLRAEKIVLERAGRRARRLYSTHPPDESVVRLCRDVGVKVVVYPEHFAHGPEQAGPTDAVRALAVECDVTLHASNVLHPGFGLMKMIFDPDVVAPGTMYEPELREAEAKAELEPDFIRKPWRERTPSDDTNLVHAELARISSEYGPPGLHPVAKLVGPRGEQFVGRPRGIRLKRVDEGHIEIEPKASPWALALDELTAQLGSSRNDLRDWTAYGTHDPDLDAAQALMRRGLRDFRIAMGVGVGGAARDEDNRVMDALRKKRARLSNSPHIAGLGLTCKIAETGDLTYRSGGFFSSRLLRDPCRWDIHSDPAARPPWA